MRNSPGWSRLYAAVICQAFQDYARGVSENWLDERGGARKFLLNCCKQPRNKQKIIDTLDAIDTGELRSVFSKQKTETILKLLLEILESDRHRDNGIKLAT